MTSADPLEPAALELYSAIRPQYRCADEAASLYQPLLREQVFEVAASHPEGEHLLRAAALAHLEHENLQQVEHALSVLFVVGCHDDLDSISALTDHPAAPVAKAARTCQFEIRHRA